MKERVILLFTLCFFSFIAANAQSPFQLGFKAGANVSKLNGESFSNQFQFGYHGGAFAQIKIAKKWQVQPEVLFNQYATKTGTKFNEIYQGSNFKDVKLNYLTIPMLLNYAPQKWIAFQGGAQVGVLMDKQKSLVKNGQEAFKTGDVSLLGGLQLNVGIIKVQGRYYYGLNNVNKINPADSWKNEGFQVSVGIRII
jgi:Outer membrane protein beta-barrel domain